MASGAGGAPPKGFPGSIVTVTVFLWVVPRGEWESASGSDGPPSTSATLSISNSASSRARAMSRGGSRTGSWVTVTMRLGTEAETLRGAGDSRQRMSEMR